MPHEQDFGKINVSTFADTRRADSTPKLEGIWVKDDSPQKGALRLKPLASRV